MGNYPRYILSMPFEKKFSQNFTQHILSISSDENADSRPNTPHRAGMLIEESKNEMQFDDGKPEPTFIQARTMREFLKIAFIRDSLPLLGF